MRVLSILISIFGLVSVVATNLSHSILPGNWPVYVTLAGMISTDILHTLNDVKANLPSGALKLLLIGVLSFALLTPRQARAIDLSNVPSYAIAGILSIFGVKLTESFTGVNTLNVYSPQNVNVYKATPTPTVTPGILATATPTATPGV